MDIDFFKTVNDTYGHNTGDDVLKLLANILKNNVRDSSDYIIRWGGEEFIIILTDCKINKAYEIGERIRNSVDACHDAVCHFTLSLGVTEYSGEDYNDSIKNADKALYYAKQHGRNQVRLYQNNEII